MTSELRILKHIDCPAGSKCTSVRCLFRHADDDDTAEPVPAPQPHLGSLADAQTDGAGDPPSHQDGPSTKRLKTGQEEYDPTAPITLLPEDEQMPDSEQAAPKPVLTQAKRGPVTANTADPIPQKRKRPDASPEKSSSFSPTPRLEKQVIPNPFNTGESSQSSLSKRHAAEIPFSTSPSTKPPRSVASETVKMPERKPETLNPRHMNSNPARFEVRYKLVKMLHEQYSRLNKELQKTGKGADTKKLILSDQELIWMVLDEEEAAAGLGNNYSHSLKSRVIACKKFTPQMWREEREAVLRKAETAASDKNADGKTENSTEPVGINTGLTPSQEVQIVKTRLKTPIEDLAKFGYVPNIPADEEIAKAREAEKVARGWEVCDRCTRRFQVFPGRREEDGALASGGKCLHHHGKPYMPNRSSMDRSIPERQYRCCGETLGQSSGCTEKDTHVFRHSNARQLAALWNFVETPENPTVPADRAVCFDCEMGYTAKGFELIRFTATSWPDGAELIDVLVRPYGEVLDLNSTYSGVWPQDMANALPFCLEELGKPPPPVKEGERRRLQMVSSPEVARDLLFSLISRDTPLIGHGLENDLNCMRVVHPVVVDTVLLYPHNRGLPVRNSLRMLMATLLNRRIQVEPTKGQLQGHDSAEDARSAGDLVRFKVKKEWWRMEREGWRFVGDKLVAPEKKTGVR